MEDNKFLELDKQLTEEDCDKSVSKKLTSQSHTDNLPTHLADSTDQKLLEAQGKYD